MVCKIDENENVMTWIEYVKSAHEAPKIVGEKIHFFADIPLKFTANANLVTCFSVTVFMRLN